MDLLDSRRFAILFFLKFLAAWIGWHFKAFFWYIGLVFRLWFAIGLDHNFDHSDSDISRHFKYPKPKPRLRDFSVS